MQTACAIAADVAAGRQRAVDVCEAALARIAAADGGVNAFLEVTADHARAAAAGIDAAVAEGRPVGPLAGVPIAIKDNICTRVGRTTCASRILRDYVSPFDATAVERLVAAGAVIVGKTNLDEFGMGSSTENSGVAPTRNPWNPDYIPGGSSGGSAVAVATRMVPLALGTDTGGSIRQPASMCGVVGIKPSYGRVSRYGLVAYGSSLDQVGVLATCVEDAAVALCVIAGHDDRDATCVTEAVPDYAVGLGDDLRGLRVGLPREYLGEGLKPEVQQAVEAAIDVYRQCGAEIVEISLPHTHYTVATYYLIATAEASSNLARYDGVRYGHRAEQPAGLMDLYCQSRAQGFGPEVKRRIMLGTFALSAGYYDAYYHKALQVRRLIKQDFDRAFEQVDVIACPVAPTPAYRLGERVDDPLAMYLGDIFTNAANLAGLPGLVVPCGFTPDDLPVGLQLIGPLYDEARLLAAGALYQRRTDWHTRTPPHHAADPA